MYEQLFEALRQTGIEFVETEWEDADRIGGNADYGIIDIDGAGDTVWGDDQMGLQAIEGTVDLFTHDAGRDKIDIIQGVFNDLHVSFRLNAVQYERNRHLTHYTWIFQLEAIE